MGVLFVYTAVRGPRNKLSTSADEEKTPEDRHPQVTA